MRVMLGILLGIAAGAVIFAIGAALNYVWDNYIYEWVVAILVALSGGEGSRFHWDGKSFHGVQLVNVLIWYVVVALGVAVCGHFVHERFARFVSAIALSWSATVVIFLGLLFIGGFMVFLGYATSTTTFGLVLFCAYAVLFVAAPTWGCISAARVIMSEEKGYR